MKTWLPLIFGLISVHAQAGVGAGGGGTAVVCRAADHSIAQAMLLDLYEAQAIDGYKLVASSGSFERDFYLAAVRTYELQGAPHATDGREKEIDDSLRAFFVMTTMKPSLVLRGDTGPTPSSPESCAIEQLAIFHDDGPSIEINSEIWAKLDALNKSALITHELFYQFERQNHEVTSETTRAVVARLYAVGVVPVLDGVPSIALSLMSLDPATRYVQETTPESVSSTWTSISSFKVFPITTPNGMGTRLQFDSIASRPVVTKTYVDVDGISFKLKRIVRRGELVCVVDEPGVSVKQELDIHGSLRPDWTLEIEYVTDQPVKLVVLSSGVAISNEVVTDCE